MPGPLNVICYKYKNQIFPTLNEAKLEAKLSESHLSENMNESELKNNWFKTWHDNDYCKLDQTSESLPSEGENISNGQFNNHKSEVPLNRLLENIPLAYSPITKQLHVLAPKESNKISSNIGCQLFDKSDKNCDDNLNVPSHKPPTNHSGAKETAKVTEQVTVQNDDEEFLCKAWNDQIGYSDETPKNEPSVTRTETSSFSSIVSSLSENSTFNNQEDNTSGKLSILDNDDLSVRSLCSQDSGSTCGENSKFFDDGTSKEGKRKGFTGFFSRNVFAWKPANSLSSQGWKIFGRHPGQDASSQSEAESQVSVTNSPSNSKKYEDVVVSSSALILHKRPANLPAKSFDEQQKHILEYEQIVEAARKKEVKESKKRKKQLQQQLKFEEQLTNASKIWTCEVLPKWETMKNARKTRDLWWAGLPPSVRGKIWKLAIGNELNITYQLYEICSARAQERLKNVELNSEEIQTNDANKESSVELIQLDISRTFPQLCIFQKGGPYYDILHCLLGAYVCYRPDVGYVQGMSFIAAVLILNLEPADAFICFANLLNRPCHLAFFTLNQSLMNAYYDAYNGFFKENLPKLYQHFQDSCLTPDLYLLDWVYSVFAKAMHLDIACRVWDVFLRDGEEFLFRTALGILHLHQEKLLKLDFINGAQFLRKLPEDLSADLLFKSIDSIKMCVGKVKFSQVLAGYLDKHSDR